MYVLIDMGYLMFYRFHATKRWLQYQKPLDSEPTDEYVINLFEKHLVSQLDKLKKKYKEATFIFCEDDRQANIWRKDIYPEYKATRGAGDVMVPVVYAAMLRIIPNYGKVYGAPRLEADDIAFLIVKRIRQDNPTAQITIITSDRDYLQLVDEHIQLIDGAGKEFRGSGDATKDLWMKIIMGDKSDNIPGIAKGCGKKTAEALASDPSKLEEFVKTKGCSANLERNTTLVCMDRIPSELQNTFYQSFILS